MKTETHLPTPASIARELADSFTTNKRRDGTPFVRIADTAPKWVKSEYNAEGYCLMLRVHRALDDRGPDDWTYAAAASIAADLAEYDDIDAMLDAACDIADRHVDVYNVNLTKWLASNLANVIHCDEAVEQLDTGLAGGVIGFIQAGQYEALRRIAEALVSEIERELARRVVAAT